MVRINIINPEFLSDQHLIAEYNEILMLTGFAKKHPNPKNIPKKYCLGKGHINFFRNKLGYLQKRFEKIKQEMKKRKFKPAKKMKFKKTEKNNYDWKPTAKDKEIIKKRLMQKIKLNPHFYRHYGKKKSPDFFEKKMKIKQKKNDLS
jgi:deoxyribonuclease (pyrimidine dimer)